MLSRLPASYRLVNGLKTTLFTNASQLKQSVVCKRWSGHNTMNIEPSNYGWKHFKDMVHFYTLLTSIPIIVISTIINIRANPELTEIPEGYEPRHWEYYKHPITRWMAKYVFKPMEIEHELYLALHEGESENMILQKIQRNVEAAMRFYNDHRTHNFRPYYAEYFRIGRDDSNYGELYMGTNEGKYHDFAYDPKINPVPTEGYVPSDRD